MRSTVTSFTSSVKRGVFNAINRRVAMSTIKENGRTELAKGESHE
jgi:hypothetical protein